MFWVHSQYRAALEQASVHGYDAIAQLPPADHYVEKQGRSTGRYVVRADERPLSFYLKKYFRLPWWQRWFRGLASFPGPRELANLRRVAALGIQVPEPVAAGARRGHSCASLLAVRELEGYLPLHEYIPQRLGGAETPDQLALRRALTQRIAQIARRLHAASLFHCDLYLCHFFIRETLHTAPERFDLVLIDLTRLKRSRLARWRVKDLAQLLYSSDLPGITRSDRLRFFKHYLGLRRLDFTARCLLRLVEWKAQGYRRHNHRAAA